MKLLIYSHFSPPSTGGVETIVLSLAKGLANFRNADGAPEFDITLITQTAAGDFDDVALPLRVVRQPSFIELWRLIRSADVVHLAGPALAPLLLSALARKPVVVEHHGFQTICPNGQLFIESSRTPCPGHFMARHHQTCLRCNAKGGWLRSTQLWLLTFIRRYLCSGIAANIAPTEWLAGMLHLPKVSHIPHGLQCSPENPRPLASPPVVAFQGRLVSTKGVSVLLEAARILRDEERPFELLIIGDGPEYPLLQELSKNLGLTSHVTFAGRLSTSEIDAALSRATLLAVPSLGGEVFGLVVAENMSRKLPVVASNLGAFVEVLGDSGRTFRTGDASDLASQIALLLDNPALAIRLGELARRRVLEFYCERNMIERHAHVYRDLGVRANL